MTEAELRDGLFETIRNVLGDPDLALTLATTAKDVPGWDSLKQVMIILNVEDRFEVRLGSREIDAVTCVGDFLQLLAAKTA